MTAGAAMAGGRQNVIRTLDNTVFSALPSVLTEQ